MNRLKLIGLVRFGMTFCNECGEKNSEGSKYCVACGNKLVGETSVKAPVAFIPKSVEKSPSINNKVKGAIVLGSSLVLASLIAITAVGLFVIRPVAIEFSLTSRDSVTFQPDCKPTPLSDPEKGAAIEIAHNSEGTPVFQTVQGTWKNGPDNACVFTGSTFIPRSAATYSARLSTANNVAQIATNLESPAGFDSIALTADVTKYQTVSGTLDLNVDVSRSTFLECLNSLSFIVGGTCGSLKMPKIGTCSGAGGYSDIGGGSVIRVSTDEDKELGIGKLSEGKGGSVGDWDEQLDDRWETTCSFTFSVEVPEIKGDYRVGISDRGERSYSKEEMESNSWKINLSLG